MTDEQATQTSPEQPQDQKEVHVNVTLRIVSGVIYNLIAYTSIGFGAAVIPSYVHNKLGYTVGVASFVYSIQYLATCVSQPTAGWICDHIGAKRSVVMGMATNTLYAVLLLVALVVIGSGAVGMGLGVLIVARLAQGLAEGWSTTGTTLWNIARVGGQHTAQVISWNGVTSYGGIALGSFLGAEIYRYYNMYYIALFILVISIVGLVVALVRPHIAPPPLKAGGKRLSIGEIINRIFLHGTALGFGSIGFGIVTTFTVLYFQTQSWDAYAGMTIASFGIVFVLVRLLFGLQIDRVGGYPVAFVSFIVETIGALIYWVAPGPIMAMIGSALIGGGFSLVFPALGVEITKIVGAENRGSAIGLYSLFLDFAMIAITLLGIIQGHFGFSVAIFIGVIITGLGGIVTVLARNIQYRNFPQTRDPALK